MDLDFLSVNKKREEKNVVYGFQVELDCRNFGFMWREKSPRSNIFHGRLTSVNMWDKVLSESDIAAQYKNCSVPHGSVLNWSAFKNLTHGNVTVEEPWTTSVNDQNFCRA